MMEVFPSPSLVEKLLFPPSDLPIIGSSALQQILQEDSSNSSYSGEEAMSPDSSSSAGSLTVKSECLPDSTTTVPSVPLYDSDAFDSDDSNSSLAELGFLPGLAGQSPVLASQLRPTPFLPESHPALVPSVKKKKKKTKKAGDVLLTCDSCSYSTRYKEHLTSHKNTHVTERNFMCSDCGQTFKWGHSLKRHQRTHSVDTYKYICRFCLKSFSRKDHLSIHEGLHTQSESSYPCTDCGASFKSKKTLAGHLKTHTAEKSFKCSECDSEFTRRASLNRHVRAAHAGHVLICSLCPAVFSYRSTLEDHKKAVHNEGRRDYSCNLCGVTFAVKSYLSKHSVTCQNRADGKSFSCEICSKNYPTKRHLSEHVKRKHRDIKPVTESTPSIPAPPIYREQIPPNYYSQEIKPEFCGNSNLSHLDSYLHPNSVEENVGSIMRQVFGCDESNQHFNQILDFKTSDHLLINSPYPSTLEELALDCL